MLRSSGYYLIENLFYVTIGLMHANQEWREDCVYNPFLHPWLAGWHLPGLHGFQFRCPNNHVASQFDVVEFWGSTTAQLRFETLCSLHEARNYLHLIQLLQPDYTESARHIWSVTKSFPPCLKIVKTTSAIWKAFIYYTLSFCQAVHRPKGSKPKQRTPIEQQLLHSVFTWLSTIWQLWLLVLAICPSTNKGFGNASIWT